EMKFQNSNLGRKMVGRKPKPTALHLIQGSFNATRHADRSGAPQPSGEVVKPGFVKGPAERLWNKYATPLIAQGVLTSWDVDMFGVCCVMMAEFQKAPQRFTAAWTTQMRALASSFGLLPADRARLHTPKPISEDPAQKYFQH